MSVPWSSILPGAAAGVPLTLALVAAVAPLRAPLGSAAALLLALLFAGGTWLTDVGTHHGVRGDALTGLMLLLVTALGAVVVRFSRTYLAGEPGLARYFRWMLLALSAVSVLVLSNSLLVMAVAWTATSLALHPLLTFYSDRPAAVVAAHKKFIVARLADGALAAALWLLHANIGTLDLDRIAEWASAQARLPGTVELGACLLVLAVALRSAQLPFHGWITQVMEAPTPVSALLHAGVVNMGGFVLIRLSPLMSLSEPAQLLLVVIGLGTTLVAALVMTTRVSVKVALAWSTSAQMGYMLLECGLGLWSLALLHLVAHSLYKAFAFLSAGAAVEQWTASAWAARRPGLTWRRLLGATAGALCIAILGLSLLGPALGLAGLHEAPGRVLTLLLGLSLVPLLASGAPAGVRGAAAWALRVGGVVLLYAAWHALAERAFPAPHPVTSPLGWWMTAVGFLGLFALKSTLQCRPNGALAGRLHPWLFSGFYLDELFTRLTFWVWPPRRAPASAAEPPTVHLTTPAEVRS